MWTYLVNAKEILACITDDDNNLCTATFIHDIISNSSPVTMLMFDHKPADGQRVLTDILPYVADYAEECLFDTNFILANSQHANLFARYCTSVIEAHFQCMVLNIIREMAEKYGKYFAIEYNFNGKPTPNSRQLFRIIKRQTRILGSSLAFPIIGWIIRILRTTQQDTGVHIQQVQCLQPWPIGAFSSISDLDWSLQNELLLGKAQAAEWGVKYLGAFTPGGSNRNAVRAPADVPPFGNRYNGTFYEEQLRLFSNDTLKPCFNFDAMFDEYSTQVPRMLKLEDLPLDSRNPGFIGTDDDMDIFYYMDVSSNYTAVCHELWGQECAQDP
ncbi:hypothetical protein BDZ45DRAFT_741183 [Acephala macrosclerotiorum]|nr:hypothetical protein BDZ45DRAFT_741183 [Acephala macrosclerotiorum]